MKMLSYFFSWYQGAVWSNLLASLLWALPTVFLGFKKIRNHSDKLHREQMEHISKIHKHLGIKDESKPHSD